jgi:uncharacterized protein
MQPSNGKSGYAFNQTRQSFLATEVRVANTHFQRLMGLMGTPRGSLHTGCALWIQPCHGVHTMFMRYPIDVVYLDRDFRVVKLEENVRPWRVTPVIVESATVLELPAHTVFNTGTKVGDVLEIKLGQGEQNGESSLRTA